MPDDSEYIYAFERLIYPVLKEFDPELLIVSAGFDSAKGDPLGDLGVTQDGTTCVITRLCIHGQTTDDTCQWKSDDCVGGRIQP